MDALLGGEQSFVWSAAAAAAGLRKQRGRERGDRALEAELRAWKSLGGRGDSAPVPSRPVYLCFELAPRAACLPFPVQIRSPAGSALPRLAVSLTAAIGRTGGLLGCSPSGLRSCTGE